MNYQCWSINLSSSRKTSYIILSDFHPLNLELLSVPSNNIFVACLIWLFRSHIFHFSCVFWKLLFKKLSFLKAETESSILKINFWKSTLVRSLSYLNCCMDFRCHRHTQSWSGPSRRQSVIWLPPSPAPSLKASWQPATGSSATVASSQSLSLAILFPAPGPLPTLFLLSFLPSVLGKFQLLL